MKALISLQRVLGIILKAWGFIILKAWALVDFSHGNKVIRITF